jgi:hypothetical protein
VPAAASRGERVDRLADDERHQHKTVEWGHEVEKARVEPLAREISPTLE